jgi:MFS family permease
MVTAAFPLLGVAALVLGLVPTRVTVLAVQPLVAAGFAAWFVGQSRLVAERVPAHQLAYAQTLTSSAGRAAAGILAGVVGGGIAAAYGYRALFLALAALCLLGGVRALTVPRDGALAATGEPR